MKRAYKKEPSQKALDELRKWLRDYPELWRVVFDTARLIEDNFIKNMMSEKASIIAMQKNTGEVRRGLGYDNSSIMEQMLIDNVIISWLGVQWANFQLTARMGKDEKIGRSRRILGRIFGNKRIRPTGSRTLKKINKTSNIKIINHEKTATVG